MLENGNLCWREKREKRCPRVNIIYRWKRNHKDEREDFITTSTTTVDAKMIEAELQKRIPFTPLRDVGLWYHKFIVIAHLRDY